MNKTIIITSILGAILILFSGCSAIQPFARADVNGYEAGVKGTWQEAATSVQSIFSKGEKPKGGGK